MNTDYMDTMEKCRKFYSRVETVYKIAGVLCIVIGTRLTYKSGMCSFGKHIADGMMEKTKEYEK